MSLKEKIQDNIKIAMKSKDNQVVSVLRMLNAAILNKEKAKLKELTEDEVIEVIFSETKKRKDSIEQYGKGGRQALVDQEQAELEILQKYLPKQMTEDVIRKLVQEKIKQTGVESPKEIGKLMSVLMPLIKGKADGKLVSQIVQEELTK